MMFLVFIAMSAGLTLAFFDRPRLSLLTLFICFVLAVGLFLWEIYSPEYGFRMPWIQTDIMAPASPQSQSVG